jgi:hypothetical protein
MALRVCEIQRVVTRKMGIRSTEENSERRLCYPLLGPDRMSSLLKAIVDRGQRSHLIIGRGTK